MLGSPGRDQVTFQPFGYHFELHSPMTPTAAKTAIRAKLSHWFTVTDSPHGFIIGPVIYLRFSAYDLYGPMVLALLKRDGLRSRMTGRAGADLSATLVLLVLIPSYMGLLVFSVAQFFLEDFDGGHAFLLIFWLGVILSVWFGRDDRHGSDLLLKFLRCTVVGPEAPPVRKSPAIEVASGATLELNDEGGEPLIYEHDLVEKLSGLASGEFATLAFEPERFTQVMVGYNHFIIEKREGSADKHYAAELEKGIEGNGQADPALHRLIAYMVDYAHNRPPANELDWKRLEL